MNVRITCTCRTCKANAAKIGRTTPLAATVDAKALGQTDPNSRKASGLVHGLVHIANDPSGFHAAGAARSGIHAA